MHAPLPFNQPVQRAAFFSAIAAAFLTLMKVIVGIQTNSLGILAEAAHSSLDLVAALITFWAVKLSSKPADEDHHFGHGKIENFAAICETLLLWATCCWIVWEAMQRITGKAHPEIEASFWGFAVIIVSIIIDVNRSAQLGRIAKEHNSPALAADALHFQSDIYSSCAVLIGLVACKLGFPWADTAAALMVAAWTFYVGSQLAKESFDQLLDKAPTGVDEQILELIRNITDIKVVSSLKVRQSGPQTFINLTIGLDKTMSFEKAHSITEDIENLIHKSFPRSTVVIHAEPI